MVLCHLRQPRLQFDRRRLPRPTKSLRGTGEIRPCPILSTAEMFLCYCAKRALEEEVLRDAGIVDESKMIDGHLPGEIACAEQAHYIGQVVWLEIAQADGDMRHPVFRRVVVKDTLPDVSNRLPECLVNLGQFEAAHDGDVEHRLWTGEDAQAGGFDLKWAYLACYLTQDWLKLSGVIVGSHMIGKMWERRNIDATQPRALQPVDSVHRPTRKQHHSLAYLLLSGEL